MYQGESRTVFNRRIVVIGQGRVFSHRFARDAMGRGDQMAIGHENGAAKRGAILARH